MTDMSIYKDIAERTGGDIYIGVVGPVRTGKSTLIQRFMSSLALPNMPDGRKKERARDELPQSGSGKTVMTTEPKFVPEEAVTIDLGENASFRLKMIDCVGYIVPDALGHTDNDGPRMVMTPWSEEAMPFEKAAETGTKKVITEHSTVGLLVTTDGTIGDIPRGSYIDAERRAARELKEINKPFAVVLNSSVPSSPQTKALAETLSAEYGASVIPVNCREMGEGEILDILKTLLYEFPVKEISFSLPSWFASLGDTHPLKKSLGEKMRSFASGVRRISDVGRNIGTLSLPDEGIKSETSSADLGSGKVRVAVSAPEKLFYRLLGEKSGFVINDDKDLFELLTGLSKTKKEYDKVESAIKSVKETGYGIVSPSLDDLTLEEPVIVKQTGGYGVRLKASAPSIHMIRADVETEVSPMVGTERQSEELVKFLLKEFEEDPKKIWESDMFGKSLYELVGEGLNNKLAGIPEDAREKLAETLRKMINEGGGGLICILL